VALAALLLAGCGAAPQSTADNSVASSPSAAPMQPEMAQSDGSAGIPGDATSAALNRRLIARASIDLVVENPDATLAAIDTMLADLGGYISNTNLYASSDQVGSQ